MIRNNAQKLLGFTGTRKADYILETQGMVLRKLGYQINANNYFKDKQFFKWTSLMLNVSPLVANLKKRNSIPDQIEKLLTK